MTALGGRNFEGKESETSGGGLVGVGVAGELGRGEVMENEK